MNILHLKKVLKTIQEKFLRLYFFMFMNHKKYINNLSVDIIFDGCINLNGKEVSNCVICDYYIFPNNKIIDFLLKYIQDFNKKFGKKITKIFFVDKNGKITYEV